MDLFGHERDDSAAGTSLKVNEDFASRYDAKKRREELSKLQDKYVNEDEDEDSTDYSSEDSEAEFVTPQVDAAILKIIGRIRAGDESLYEKDGNFFKAEEDRLAINLKDANAASKKSKKKPLKLKDYQRKALLAGAGNGSLSDDEDAASASLALRTPAQEANDLQKETRAAFLTAFSGTDGKDSEDSGSDDDDDLLVKREDGIESDEEEDQYRRFLLDNVGAQELEKILALREEDRNASTSHTASGATEDDFLKNYILNRGWLDKRSNKLPSYKEITKFEDDEPAPGPSIATGSNTQPLDHEDSDEELERAEAFENRYNFRFEEAAGGEIQTHARDVGTSMRREDNSRKQQREGKSARKAEQKQERMRELERLNALKKQHILEKIAKIKAVAGAAEGFDMSALDLEADYDPSTHNAKMAKVFNDLFYQDETVDVNGKPVWEDDIDISDLPLEQNYAPGGEAYDPTEAGTSGKKSRAERKKDKKQSKRDKGKGKAEEPDEEAEVEDFDAIADPEERRRRVERYMEEYYKLNHEDMIGDLPTRFHYASRPAEQSQGDDELTAIDILMATDAELNAYESLKRIAPYRKGSSKEGSKKRWKLKEFRRNLGQRRWGDEYDENAPVQVQSVSHKRKRDGEPAENSGKPKKRLGKKQRQKLKMQQDSEGPAVVDE